MKQTIIKLHLEGVSQRGINRRTGVSRNTVSKYIKRYEDSRDRDVRNLPITEEILREPNYKKRKGISKVLTEEIKEKLRRYIKENEWKKQNRMQKQQMKMVDMHEMLLDEGHIIGYTSVRNFVNKEIEKKREVFIHRHCEPGYEVEFDWGEIKLSIGGKIRSYSLAVFTLAHSNYRFARIYESESMVCVMDVHVNFVEHIGFIPTVFTYDNMRTVVKEFIGTERKITDSMKHLSEYYQFNIRLCQPRKGNEKGHVERSVEYVRRKAFSQKIIFNNLKEAEDHLVKVLEKINNRPHHEHRVPRTSLIEKEKAVSKPSITPFDVADLVEVRVDKYSTVVIRQNHYSVPEGHVGKYIKAKVGAKEIRLFIDGQLVAVHQRNWSLHQWVMDIEHYLQTFKKKRGALLQSECLRQAPQEIKNIYYSHYIGNEKDFIELLLYIRENNNFDMVTRAIEQLREIRYDHVNTERILFICEQSHPEDGDISTHRDETVYQSENNMKAYADMFNQTEEVINL